MDLVFADRFDSLSFSYGYCVRGAIVNIVARESMEKDLSTLNSKVLDLESKYIKAKK